MKEKDKMMLINSIKVLVSPWEKGFTCGIIMDSKSKMATTDPHSTFLWGLRGFADDKKKETRDLTISAVSEFDDESNVVDFLEFLKQKRDKELN